jgi:peroxiredoxin
MKKLLKAILIAVISIIGGFLTYQTIKGYNEKKEAEKRIQTLPQAEFVSLTGKEVNLHDFDPEKPMVIVYFHPECDHCHSEAQEIGQNAAAFRHCQVVMVTSDDSLKRVENFCAEYHLWELNNIEVLHDPNNRFKKVFGKAVVPSVYIYDESWKLKRYFPGETKPEAIISEINS